MQIENRKYEHVLQFIGGFIIVVVLTQCLFNTLLQLWIYLSH